jgi:hypothetical protein
MPHIKSLNKSRRATRPAGALTGGAGTWRSLDAQGLGKGKFQRFVSELMHDTPGIDAGSPDVARVGKGPV